MCRPRYDVKLPIKSHQFKLNTMPQFVCNPNTWKLFPPQFFATPKNYIKWKELIKNCSLDIVNTVSRCKLKQKNPGLNFNFETPQGLSLLITDCIGKSIPPICIHENVIESLINTEIKSMNKPQCAFDTFIFLFPLTYKTFNPWNAINDTTNLVGFDKKFFVAFVRLTEDIIDCVFKSSNGVATGIYEWSNIFTLEDASSTNNLLEINNTIMYERLIKNAILIYTYDSKYVTEEMIKVSASKGFGSVVTEDKPLPVRWLGKIFKEQRIKYTIANQSEINNLNKRAIRSHWRKGHWHTICTGTKRKERQVRWFKPTFVNAN